MRQSAVITALVVQVGKDMRSKRRNGITALWIALMILFSAWSVLLFAEVDSDIPMYEEGVVNEQRADK